MVYITVKQSPMYHQMTLEEFLFGDPTAGSMINANTTNTRTYVRDRVSERFLTRIDVDSLIQKLATYNRETAYLRQRPRCELYHTFSIPKRSGGFRRIDAPLPELMDALRRLKTIFEVDFAALYHTSAYAYVRGRSTVDAVKCHQKNKSRWFGKYDLKGFFPNTTLDFVMRQLSVIFPFSEVIKTSDGETELKTALELAFLNGGLPQGTPISPLITNVMMIPIDYALTRALRDFENQGFTITRYADDFIVSSKYDFDFKRIEQIICETLTNFGSPHTINSGKTRYGSSSGSNWNLGVMLNKDGDITVGSKRKRQFQSMLYNFIRDKRGGVDWSLSDMQVLLGYYSYYKMVEGASIDNIIAHVNKKHNTDVLKLVKDSM